MCYISGGKWRGLQSLWSRPQHPIPPTTIRLHLSSARSILASTLVDSGHIDIFFTLITPKFVVGSKKTCVRIMTDIIVFNKIVILGRKLFDTCPRVLSNAPQEPQKNHIIFTIFYIMLFCRYSTLIPKLLYIKRFFYVN